MKDLFKKITKNTKRLQSIEEQIENVKVMPYYSIFGNAHEREKDLRTCYDAKAATLDERHMLLENLALETQKELMRLSNTQMKNTLQKTA